jgi:hypothetical protein
VGISEVEKHQPLERHLWVARSTCERRKASQDYTCKVFMQDPSIIVSSVAEAENEREFTDFERHPMETSGGSSQQGSESSVETKSIERDPCKPAAAAQEQCAFSK